jgi:hypothetical protein
MSLAQCRYNSNHKMKQARLLIHEEQCPDRKNRILKTCPYNPIHKLAPENYEKHKRSCPSAPKIDKETEDEIREYIRNKNENPGACLEENTNEQLPTRYGTKIVDSKLGKTNSINQPIGMRNLEEEKKLKKERKNKQREMMNLIENSAMEIESQFSEDKEIDAIYDQEFINFNVQNNLVKLDDSLRESHFNHILDNIDVNTEYDPNASDLVISKQNRNQFKFPQKSDGNFSLFSECNGMNNSISIIK